MLNYYPHLTDRNLHLREMTALTGCSQEACAVQKPQSKAMQTQRPNLLPQVPAQHLWEPDFPETIPQSVPHKQDFKPLHDKLKAIPRSLADRNQGKCIFKAANNVIYTCWEFDPIHSLHPIMQTINH